MLAELPLVQGEPAQVSRSRAATASRTARASSTGIDACSAPVRPVHTGTSGTEEEEQPQAEAARTSVKFALPRVRE